METDAMQGGQIDGEKSGRTGKWKCLCEGFEPDQEAAGPMFPHTNQMEAWDDYGQPLPESFLASFNQAQQVHNILGTRASHPVQRYDDDGSMCWGFRFLCHAKRRVVAHLFETPHHPQSDVMRLLAGGGFVTVRVAMV